jgi:uncharacterized protein
MNILSVELFLGLTQRKLTVICGACEQVTFNRTGLSIPMRDGNFLAADVFYPRPASGPLPVILVQTPYDRRLVRPGYLLGIEDPLFASPNYIWVWVDWRGFFGSLSAAVPGYNRGLDGYDTVEWIANQTWCTGAVGTWGASALGTQQYKTLAQQPPHLKASMPMVGNIADTYELAYPGGALI